MSTYLNDWCERLKTAAKFKDYSTISEMTGSVLSPDDSRNPIKLAIKIDYEFAIPQIVEALQMVEGLDSRRIAQLLMLSRCPIRNVVSQRSVDIVRHMIGMGSPVNDAPGDSRPDWRTSALHAAAAGGDAHLGAVQLLLEHGADPHRTDSLGYTPLHRCLEASRCLEVARLLLSRGARGDSLDVARTSCLVTAVRNRQPLELVRLLVEAGADPALRDGHGCTALHYAAREQRADLVDYLLDRGVEPNSRNLAGENALLYAAWQARLEFLRYLVLVCGVDAGAVSGRGRSLLHSMSESCAGRPPGATCKRAHSALADKVRFCLLRGADVNARDAEGRTPLEMALANRDSWLDVLLEHVAVREFMDRRVDEASSARLYANDFCLSYLVACKIELVALMDMPVYNDVRLFNILTDDDARMAGYVRNEELVEAFQRTIAMQLFLIYSAALVERFNYFLDLHRMRQRAIAVLAGAFRGALDYAGVELIARHLSNRDLYKLSRCGEE